LVSDIPADGKINHLFYSVCFVIYNLNEEEGKETKYTRRGSEKLLGYRILRKVVVGHLEFMELKRVMVNSPRKEVLGDGCVT
jgi:hypothetical protein